MVSLALFTAVKAFTDPDTARHQRNALRTWRALGESVEVLLIGEEPGAAAAAREVGARLVPVVERTRSGTPLIRSLFEQARQASDAPLLAFANADIVLLSDFLTAVEAAAVEPAFLLVSRRWDLPVPGDLSLDPGWEDRLRREVRTRGRRHPPAGSDLFVFPRECFAEVPPLAVGRAGWDNWMIFEARRRRWPVIDASGSFTLIHQDHDYRHLPGGRPHYRHPESEDNIRLAGGRSAAFTLVDADWVLDPAGPRPRRAWEKPLLRSVEVWLLLRVPARGRGWVRGLFHPLRAAAAVRGWWNWRRSRTPGSASAQEGPPV